MVASARLPPTKPRSAGLSRSLGQVVGMGGSGRLGWSGSDKHLLGYLATEDTSEYLSRALVDTLRGTLADNENRLCTLLFKLCVEVNMMGHTVAAHFRADPVNRRELRAYAVDEVLRTNGKIRFDDALDLQRQIFPDGE